MQNSSLEEVRGCENRPVRKSTIRNISHYRNTPVQPMIHVYVCETYLCNHIVIGIPLDGGGSVPRLGIGGAGSIVPFLVSVSAEAVLFLVLVAVVPFLVSVLAALVLPLLGLPQIRLVLQT